MTERAARWVRVSSDAQDESNQVPRIDAHIIQRGYEVATDVGDNGTYEVHDKSASKGEHVAALKAALEDMAAGKYTVLIARHSDRIDRQAKVWQWMAFAHEAGGRIEFLDEPGLVYREDDDQAETMAFLAGINNRRYSRQLKKNVKDAFAARKARGAFVGKVPWGFEVWCSVCNEPSRGSDQCRQHDKMLRPCDDAKVIVPEMCRRSLAGESIDKLSAAYGLPESTIRNILTLPVYAGRYEYADGTVHLCEALVSADTQEQVQKILTARQRRGQRGAKTEPSLLIPYCLKCKSKCYRIRGGKKGFQRYCYYCSRCRFTADAERLDTIAVATLLIDLINDDEMESYWVEGDDYSSQKAEIKRELTKLDPEEDDYLDRVMALRGKLKAVPAATKGHWDVRPTGRSKGEAWAELDRDGRRAMFRNIGVGFSREADGLRVKVGDVEVVRPLHGPKRPKDWQPET